MSRQLNQVRIIGGKFRGRKINFPDVAELRPTGDKIRETAFNWLQMSINDAKCLDMFAGAGVFGFEALSRGASSVLMVVQNREVVDSIKKNQLMLEVGDQLEIIQAVIPSPELKLELSSHRFDIVFIDPPFHKGLVEVACRFLADSDCLVDDALIYIETEKELELVLPEQWEVLKEKKSGNVKYYLIECLRHAG